MKTQRWRLFIFVFGLMLILSASSSLAQRSIPGEAINPTTAQQQIGNIQVVGQTGGTVQAVALQGNYAYVGVGSRLVVLDISDPAHPTAVGQSGVMPDIVQNVVVSGTLAYIADGDLGGLRIINIANPTAPTEVGFYDTPGEARDVAVAGRYAYVADGGDGLRVIDVSNPNAPIETGFYNPSHEDFEGVAVSGTYAYIATYNSGLYVINIGDPTSPIEVGLDNMGSGTDVVVVGHYAYVAGGYRLNIVDVSNPTMPTEVSDYPAPYARGVAVVGDYAYVACSDYDGNLRVINIHTPTPHGLTLLTLAAFDHHSLQ
jgi:hypothetical protein